MAARGEKAGAPTPSLQEILTMLVSIAGRVAGAAGLTFGIGFVVVNLSLLKHGVFEGALVRERYVAAGISYMVLLAGVTIIALTARSAAERLARPRRLYIRSAVTVVLAAVMNGLLAVVVWEFKGLSGPLFIWSLASGCLALIFLYANPLRWERWLRDHNFFRKAPLTSSSDQPQPDAVQAKAAAQTTAEPEDPITLFKRRTKSPAGLTSLGILFFLLLVTYGRYVYDKLPAALGGGLPVVVQFTGDEASMAILADMGMPLKNPSTSGQFEFIGQTEERYFIFVRQTNWEESLTTGKTRVVSRRTVLAFNKELVQGIRYYPSEYYLTDDFAAVDHVQKGDALFAQEFYNGAIEEYDRALNRQPDYHPALFKRGRAYLIEARNTPDKRDYFAGLAVDDLDRAKGLNPSEASYWYHLARAQMLAGQHQTAIETLMGAVERDLSFGKLAKDEVLFEALKVREDLGFDFEEIVFGGLIEAARAYADQGQARYTQALEEDDEQARHEALTEAALAYIRAISLTVTIDRPLERASYQFALAGVYQEQAKPDLALTELEQAVEAAPDNESYRLRLATAYADQGSWARAEEEYNEVLGRNDQNVNAWLGKGEALRQQGEYQEAADAFQQASILAPENVDAWYGLGVARLAFAPAEAEAPFRRAVTLDQTYAALISGILQQAELETEARERLEAVLQAAELSMQGDAALEAGELTQAVEAYRLAVETDPVNIAYQIKLGDAYQKQGDAGAAEAYAQAATIYRQLIEQVPQEASYHFRLATAYAAQGEDADALNEYNAAVSLDPDVAAYYADRALLFDRLGRPGDAIDDLRQAIDLDGTNHLYHFRLGRIHYEQAQYKDAIDALTTATTLNPEYGLGFYYLGLARLEAGNTDAARAAFVTCTEVTAEIQRSRCEDQVIQLTTPTP
jgi:tetratricopeptide (TPR) repeat protein